MKLLQTSPQGEDISPALLREHPSEQVVVATAAKRLEPVKSLHPAACKVAGVWIEGLRENRPNWGSIEQALQEFPLDSSQGLALMRLAECYLRTPDTHTRTLLLADLLKPFRNTNAHANWISRLLGKVAHVEDHAAHGTASWLEAAANPLLQSATEQSIRKFGKQFLFAETAQEAIEEAQFTLCSFDRLGEGARTTEDAKKYFEAYRATAFSLQQDPHQHQQERGKHSLSIKLSALSPKFLDLKRHYCFADLVECVSELAQQTLPYGIHLTIDAEENHRLLLTLEILEAVINRLESAGLLNQPTVTGRLGLAVQAYNKRSLQVVDHLVRWAKEYYPGLQVRLVKGAYWDTEVASAQRDGLEDYPVLTTKAGTDLQFLACAFALLSARPSVYPMLATHNALTLATVLEYAQACGSRNLDGFECQRLHGMGEPLWEQVRLSPVYQHIPCRVYAPVGTYDVALAYLVRRLLENGANSSFVNAIHNPKVPIAKLLQDPLSLQSCNPALFEPGLKKPAALFPNRSNSSGLALHNRQVQAEIQEALDTLDLSIPLDTPPDWEELLKKAGPIQKTQSNWESQGVNERAEVLNRWAKLMQENRGTLIALLMREARKTLPDAVAEWREAIDFIYHYSAQASALAGSEASLPGPAGELNRLSWHARGQCLCISPWNFPLAIFAGQIACCLAGGNSVLAKAAPQTQRIAQTVVDLASQAGMDKDLIHLLGPETELARKVLTDWPINMVFFTGGTNTAKQIQRDLAGREGPIIPLVAETGGVNAMIVDSSALPEQACDAIVQSAFGSAGQRCSALRVVFVQRDINTELLTMVKGACEQLLQAGKPGIETDFGPLIDQHARLKLQEGLDELAKTGTMWQPQNTHGDCFGPYIVEQPFPGQFSDEWFGPVLQWVSFEADQWADIKSVIATAGWGLTLGLQSRLEERAHELAKLPVGNLYINRTMTGAVVGSQPFGGLGLSGTGPKAGGFHTLFSCMVEKTSSNNLASAGGIPDLFGPA